MMPVTFPAELNDQSYSVALSPGTKQHGWWWATHGRVKACLIALLVIAVLFPSVYVLWQVRDGSALGGFEDGDLYVGAAKSLVETGAYKIPSLPGQPYQTKYPPLYPLLLSAVWKMDPSFPGNLKWLALLDWCLWLAFLAVAFQAFRALQFDRTAQWVALFVLASNAAGQYLAVTFMPEALFSALVIGAILLAERASRSADPRNTGLWCGVITGCAFLTKTSALPLAVTVPLVFLFRRQYRRAIWFLATVAPFMVGWIAWSAVHRQHPADPVFLFYVDYFGFYRLNVTWHDLPSLVLYNFQYLQGMFKFALPSFSSVGGQNPIPALMLIPTAMCLIGTFRLFKRTHFVHGAAFCAAYLIQLLLWNFNPNGRLLQPLIPFLVAGLVCEVGFVIDAICKSFAGQEAYLTTYLRPLASCVIVALSMLASAVGARSFATRDAPQFHENRARLGSAYHWLDQNVPKDAGLVAYDDGGLYLYTGRQGVRNQGMTLPYVINDTEGIQRPIARIADFARSNGFTYVLWNAGDYDISDDGIARQLLAMNAGLKIVYQAQRVRIYRVTVGPYYSRSVR